MFSKSNQLSESNGGMIVFREIEPHFNNHLLIWQWLTGPCRWKLTELPVHSLDHRKTGSIALKTWNDACCSMLKVLSVISMLSGWYDFHCSKVSPSIHRRLSQIKARFSEGSGFFLLCAITSNFRHQSWDYFCLLWSHMSLWGIYWECLNPQSDTASL